MLSKLFVTVTGTRRDPNFVLIFSKGMQFSPEQVGHDSLRSIDHSWPVPPSQLDKASIYWPSSRPLLCSMKDTNCLHGKVRCIKLVQSFSQWLSPDDVLQQVNAVVKQSSNETEPWSSKHNCNKTELKSPAASSKNG